MVDEAQNIALWTGHIGFYRRLYTKLHLPSFQENLAKKSEFSAIFIPTTTTPHLKTPATTLYVRPPAKRVYILVYLSRLLINLLKKGRFVRS